ncbi:MAG: hypothetical protein EBS21_06075 [Sphingomonadaceae bacterium]|nr:hypothetical protein [Sphingomonadaceae bacterium]
MGEAIFFAETPTSACPLEFGCQFSNLIDLQSAYLGLSRRLFQRSVHDHYQRLPLMQVFRVFIFIRDKIDGRQKGRS